MGSRRYAFKSGLKRFLVLLLDFFGGILFFPLKFSKPPASVKKILAVRIDHLGDVLMTRPALHALRALYPGAEIHLLTSAEAARLLKSESAVDRLIAFENNWFTRGARWPSILKSALRIRKELCDSKYDLVLDFRGDFRTILLLALSEIPYRIGYGITGGGFLLHRSPVYDWGLHQSEVNLRLLRALNPSISVPPAPTLKIRVLPERAASIKHLINGEISAGPVLILHPGAGDPAKRWPEEKFGELITRLIKGKITKIVLIGTAAEKKDSALVETAEVLDLRGKTALEDLPALFENCDLFLGNDSGPAHLAAAQGVPVISIFSKMNNPEVWKPLGVSVKLLLFDVSHPIGVDEVYQAVCGTLAEGKHF